MSPLPLLYSPSEDELLWIFSMNSSATLDANLLASCVGCPLLEYGAHAASGLQSARMSLIRKDEVTVRGWGAADTGPWCVWDGSASARPRLCSCVSRSSSSSRSSRLGDGGLEHALSGSDAALNSAGDRHSLSKPPLPLATTTAGLPGLWDSRESMPKPEPEHEPWVDASIGEKRALPPGPQLSNSHLGSAKFDSQKCDNHSLSSRNIQQSFGDIHPKSEKVSSLFSTFEVVNDLQCPFSLFLSLSLI